MKRYARTAVWTAVVSTLAIGVIGFAHTPMGRPLLRYVPLPGKGMCPVLGHEPDPQALEAQRRATTAALKGAMRAGSLEAMGFALATSSREQALQWAAAHQVKCEHRLHDAALDCSEVPEGALSAFPSGLDSLFLRFDPGGKLVAIDAQARRPVPQAAAVFGQYEHAVEGQLGAPHRKLGDASLLALASGPYQRGAVEYRFSDLAVDLSVTSLPSANGTDGLMRAQFRAIAE
ncbi:MAG: hypothetical protein QM723_13075 [Myxococcaceae bacterium]